MLVPSGIHAKYPIPRNAESLRNPRFSRAFSSKITHSIPRRPNILKWLGTIASAALLATGLALPAAAETGKAALQDKSGKDVGSVDLSQTPAGVLLKLSLKGLPAGAHAVHIHAVGKCEPPSFESAGPHFNPANTKHGMLSGQGHVGDMPNLHVPPNGELSIEILNAAITLEKGKPNSVFHPGGTAVVVHEGVDDYKSDPAGNSGARLACGVISVAS